MPPPPRSRGWIWYFVILTVLTVVATTILIVYNLGQQLRPEQLAAARALWEARGPRDYELRYTTKKGTEDEPDRFVVRVRGGRTVSVLLNGRPLEARQHVYYGMTALFNDIDRFLELDAQPGKPRTYRRAMFDPADGHVLQYIRRVMGGRERLEITVEELRPLPAEGAARRRRSQQQQPQPAGDDQHVDDQAGGPALAHVGAVQA